MVVWFIDFQLKKLIYLLFASIFVSKKRNLIH